MLVDSTLSIYIMKQLTPELREALMADMGSLSDRYLTDVAHSFDKFFSGDNRELDYDRFGVRLERACTQACTRVIF